MANEERGQFSSRGHEGAPSEPSPEAGTAGSVNQPEHTGSRAMARRIAQASFVFWLISLALPGFTLGGSSPTVMYGHLILLEGVLLGWLGGVLPAYANIFYLYAGISLSKNETPFKSLIAMVCLAATTVFVRSLLTDEGGGRALITAWGWGAVLWGIALLLLVIAALTHAYQLSVQKIFWMLGAIGWAILAIVGLRVHQWSNANIQDRTAYLAPSMAFTPMKLCDVPVAQVTRRLVSEGGLVSVEASMREFLKKQLGTHYPILTRFEENGFEWVHRDISPDYEIGRKLTDDAKPQQFSLKAVPSAEGYSIQLVDGTSKRVVYEQRIKTGSYRNSSHCPSAWADYGYWQTIRKAVGQDQPVPYFVGPYRKEEGHSICDTQYPTRQPKGTREPLRYCSEHYIAMISLGKQSHNSGQFHYVSVLLLDKATLALVDQFSSLTKCTSDPCPLITAQDVRGFAVNESKVHLLLADGELIANREQRRK